MSVKIVSFNKGLKLFNQNFMIREFENVQLHTIKKITFGRQQKMPLMQIHSSGKCLAENLIINNSYELIRTIVDNLPIRHELVPWNISESALTVGLSSSGSMHIQNIFINKPNKNILIFAPHFLSSLLYRIYKQTQQVLDINANVVICTLKLQKDVRNSYTPNVIAEILKQLQPFKEIRIYNDKLINLQIFHKNGKLAQHCCNAFKQYTLNDILGKKYF